MKKVLIVMMTCLLTMPAFAGGTLGNGGDVLVCPDKVELLDTYEARKKNFSIDLPEGGLRKKVNFILNKVYKSDPYRASVLKTYANELLKDIELHEQGQSSLKEVTMVRENLRDLDDSMELTIPYNCKIKQLIIRRGKGEIRPYDIYQTQYVINEDLWNGLDDNNKAMTITHEVLYKLLTEEREWKDSRFVRHLNGLFSSSKRVTFKSYINMIEEFGMEYCFTIVEDVSARTDFVKFIMSGKPNSYYLMRLDNKVLACDSGYKLTREGGVTFDSFIEFADGKNQSVYMGINSHGSLQSSIVTDHQFRPWSSEIWTLSNGEIGFTGEWRREAYKTTSYNSEGQLSPIYHVSVVHFPAYPFFRYIIKDGVRTEFNGKNVVVTIDGSSNKILSFQYR